MCTSKIDWKLHKLFLFCNRLSRFYYMTLKIYIVTQCINIIFLYVKFEIYIVDVKTVKVTILFTQLITYIWCITKTVYFLAIDKHVIKFYVVLRSTIFIDLFTYIKLEEQENSLCKILKTFQRSFTQPVNPIFTLFHPFWLHWKNFKTRFTLKQKKK